MSSSAITGPIFTDVRRSPSGSAAAPSWSFNDSQGTGVYLVSADVLGLSTAGAQRVRITSGGAVGIGPAINPAANLDVNLASTNSTSVHVRNLNTYVYLNADTDGTFYIGTGFLNPISFQVAGYERVHINTDGILAVDRLQYLGQGAQTFGSGSQFGLYILGQAGFNAAQTGMKIGRNSSTLRSINAGGTINASGADYAEYMTKASEFTIAKGDLCGVNAEGKLTNVFSEAVAFVVKSTNPSYVGGDSWGANLEADSEELEAARQLVDRIAFCGQVPANVLGAIPGQWIIPVEENGAIKGQAVSNPSFEQYQLAVGKVIAIEEDGRARIIVKIA